MGARRTGLGIFGAQVKRILRRINRVAVVGEVGHVLAESISQVNGVAPTEAIIKRRQQAVVARDRRRLDECNRPKAAERTDRVDVRRVVCQEERLSGGRANKVDVATIEQVIALCADIAYIENSVLKDLMLHAQRPLLNLWRHEGRVDTNNAEDREG